MPVAVISNNPVLLLHETNEAEGIMAGGHVNCMLSVQCGPLSHRPDPMIKVVVRFCSVADT